MRLAAPSLHYITAVAAIFCMFYFCLRVLCKSNITESLQVSQLCVQHVIGHVIIGNYQIAVCIHASRI